MLSVLVHLGSDLLTECRRSIGKQTPLSILLATKDSIFTVPAFPSPSYRVIPRGEPALPGATHPHQAVSDDGRWYLLLSSAGWNKQRKPRLGSLRPLFQNLPIWAIQDGFQASDHL